MKFSLHRIIIPAIALAAAVLAQAIDLPVANVDGKLVHYYKVGKKESVYGIAKHLGITPEEIIKHNPQAAGGLRRGMMLYFPAEECDNDGNPVAEAEEYPDSLAADTLQTPVRGSIAILLPFGLDNARPSKTNQYALDFYKGFLIGANTQSLDAGKVDIHVFDTEDAPLDVILDKPEVVGASVIVSPNDTTALATIAAKVADRQSRVFNVFVVHDSLYLTNPMMVQANIPQRHMYSLAAQAFMSDYAGYTPVILRNLAGKNEKEAFVSYLTGRLAEKGVEPIVVEYEGNLLTSRLSELPAVPGMRYVFVPTSGTVAEFNKFAYALKTFRERLAEPVGDGEVAAGPEAAAAVFGYPDWLAFKGETLEMLHKLGATIYSRFFDDFTSPAVQAVDADFKYWFGSGFSESVPCQALLGYDTACCLLRNLRANGGVFDPVFPLVYEGLQSAFELEKTGEGYCNATLYILTYLPDGQITQRAL